MYGMNLRSQEHSKLLKWPVTKKVWPPLLLTVWPKVSAKSLDQTAESHKSLNNHNQSRQCDGASSSSLGKLADT